VTNSPLLAEPRKRRLKDSPSYLFHPSFEEPLAAEQYGQIPEAADDHAERHLPDDVTRACAMSMHYAAYRAEQAEDVEEARHWQGQYFTLRDLVIVGNRKLVFRAVRRWTGQADRTDDLIGECNLVLLRVVAVYNPWLGIRFSTYAYTCLVRALSRLSLRANNDRLGLVLSQEVLDGSACESSLPDEPVSDRVRSLTEYLRADHPLLSAREKTILTRRFSLADSGGQTLEAVGADLGLSKERVRQVQVVALKKLRRALSAV